MTKNPKVSNSLAYRLHPLTNLRYWRMSLSSQFRHKALHITDLGYCIDRFDSRFANCPAHP